MKITAFVLAATCIVGITAVAPPLPPQDIHNHTRFNDTNFPPGPSPRRHNDTLRDGNHTKPTGNSTFIHHPHGEIPHRPRNGAKNGTGPLGNHSYDVFPPRPQHGDKPPQDKLPNGTRAPLSTPATTITTTSLDASVTGVQTGTSGGVGSVTMSLVALVIVGVSAFLA
ncbi:hypothetical protein B5M09_006580 [Aphanomyces astaci]|uniref:Uncharacterized protein n=1 Tax=Aphanomyces astaci TaxID=112090 RepID=A0A3R7YSK7_APHAT|nr:hypothetical protein B5M09_006580 [Aphanomyces astaci]